MTIEASLGVIRTCIQNPDNEMIIKNGMISIRKKRFFSFMPSADYVSLAQFINQNQAKINEVFRDQYEAGYHGRKFQAQINKIGKKAGIPLPDFLKQYTSNWMGAEHVRNKKIAEILLPGTHDSGAYKIIFDKTPAFAMGFIETMVFFLARVPLLGRFIRHFFNDWTTNQKRSIGEQLDGGIRLLDFRLGKDNDGDLYLSHRYLVEKFSSALEQIRSFLSTHPNEIIIINLKVDFDYRRVFTNEDKKRARDLINDYLKDYIGERSITDATISQLAENGQRIQLYLDFGDDVQPNPHTAKEIWPNAVSMDQVIPSIQRQIDEEKNHPTASFIYPSLNTTPTGLTILYGIFKRTNLKKMGKKIQRCELEPLIGVAKTVRRPDNTRIINGVIFDRPTGSTVNRIIRENIGDDSSGVKRLS